VVVARLGLIRGVTAYSGRFTGRDTLRPQVAEWRRGMPAGIKPRPRINCAFRFDDARKNLSHLDPKELVREALGVPRLMSGNW
jgi:hypothetical protein